MSDVTLIKTMQIRNLLSFGPDAEPIEFGPLSVLIGPNAAGKSNLIEVVGLLQSTPRNFAQAILDGDGISHWLWKGDRDAPEAELNVVLHGPGGDAALRHRLTFTAVAQRLEIVDEAIEQAYPGGPGAEPEFYYRYQRGHPLLYAKGNGPRELRREDVRLDQSILAQRKDPDQYPELTYVGQAYDRIRLFQELHLGRRTASRRPQDTSLDNSFLAADAGNLALVLNHLEGIPAVRQTLLEQLQQFYPWITDFRTRTEGGTIQLFFEEQGLSKTIPATRLSDGTLRYVCLLSVLCHPAPPPLICLEEPEVGLHPDILRSLGELIIAASERTQLIITTHSDVLLSALQPEHVIVCERDANGSQLNRLSRDDLLSWLADYTLGDLWRMGQLGGNRW